MDAADLESPCFQVLKQVIERIFEFGEQQETLVRLVEKSFLLQEILELRQFRLRAGVYAERRRGAPSLLC